MNLAERIQAAEAELLTLKDALIESTKALEAAPEEESLLVQVEELTSKVEKQDKALSALKSAEKALAERAANQAPAVIPQVKKDAKGDGSLMVKMATAQVIAHINRKHVSEVLAEKYGDDQQLDAVYKSTIGPATTHGTGWAAELVQSDIQGFLNSLRTTSVAAELASRSQTLSFGGYNSITIPMRNALGGSLTEPSWVGEGGAIPVTNFGFSSLTLNRYKLGAITTMTREIVERSTPAIEAILRDGLSEAYSQVLDHAVLSTAAAVANVRPAGLLQGTTPIAGTAGGGETAVLTDMKKAITALTDHRLGARPVLIIPTANRLSLSLMLNPLGQRAFSDEIAAGRLLGVEVISSNHVPADTAILVDASTLAFALDGPSFAVSDQTVIVESDASGTAPTMASTSGQAAVGAVGTAGQVPQNGGIAVAGSTGASTTGFQARSMFQTDCLALRMIAPTSYGRLRGHQAVQVLSNITW